MARTRVDFLRAIREIDPPTADEFDEFEWALIWALVAARVDRGAKYPTRCDAFYLERLSVFCAAVKAKAEKDFPL